MYDLVIKLLNEQGKLLTGWLGRHAYPIKWSLYSREATKSELSSGIIPMGGATHRHGNGISERNSPKERIPCSGKTARP